MGSQGQFGITPVQFAATAAGVKRAPAPAPSDGDSTQGNGWARQLPGNGSAGKRRLFAAMDRRWVHLIYVLVDVLIVTSAAYAAFFIRFAPLHWWHVLHGGAWATDLPLKSYGGFLLLYAILIVLLCQSQDLYKTRRGRTAGGESWAVVRAVTLATMVLAAFIFYSSVKIVSREVVGISALLNVISLVMWRIWKRRFVTRRVAQGVGAYNALIIGAGEVGKALAQYLEQNKQLGYRVVGFLDNDHHEDSGILGKVEDLAWIARAQFVDEVFISTPSEREVVKSIATQARKQKLNLRVIPELYDGLAWNAPIQQMGQFPVMELHREPIPTVGMFFKRCADIILSAMALAVLSPLIVLVAVAIKLDSAGPVFYRSKRVGKKGATFTCYKFRTMVVNAEELKEQLGHLNERSNGLLFKMKNDPRVTRVGRLLRRFSLDELPQIWNVIKGEMSLVGPRPPLPSEFDQYSLGHLRRLDVRPGITGLWQITARSNPSFESYMALDLKYIENWQFWSDAKIILQTIPVVVKGQGQ